MRWIAWVVVAALVTAACSVGAPRLATTAAVPDDLRMLGDEVWEEVVSAFPARRGCLGGIELDVAWDLEDRARYVPDERRIVVRAPGTAPNLAASIVHEVGHHLEFACPDQLAVRDAFLVAEGFAPDTPWFGEGDWFATPSEHWAEAVVAHVRGERTINVGRIPVSDDAIDVVARWAEGG